MANKEIKTMKIYVIGPIGKVGGGEGIQKIVESLRAEGFDVVNPNEHPVDHSKDWRNHLAEAREKMAWGENFIKNEIDVLVADLSRASDGRTIEQVFGMKYGKPVLGYAPEVANTPWRLVLTTKIFRSIPEIIKELKSMT